MHYTERSPQEFLASNMVYIHEHRVISIEQAIKTHYAKLKEADILLHLTLAGRSEDSIVSTGSEALNI